MKNPFGKAARWIAATTKRAASAPKRAVDRITGRKSPAKPKPPAPPPAAPEPLTPSVQRDTATSLRSLVQQLNALGVTQLSTERDPEPSHGPRAIADLVSDIGAPNTRRLLSRQVESSRAWMRGNYQPGRRRWQGQDEEMRRYLGDEKFTGTDYSKFFWYHANRNG